MSARDRGRAGSVFDAAPSVTPTAVDSAIFGEIASVDQGKQTANPVSIFRVWPDPAQPRRAVPSAVRDQWDGNPTTVSAMLAIWFDLAQQESGNEISVAAYLEAEADEQTNRDNIGPLEADLIDLLRLAGSIHRDSLANPVTGIRVSGVDYRLETGERRWLAYHILHAYSASAAWEKIPLRIVTESNVWRQASENTARASLNAISKARQLALLIMDLLGPTNFKTRDEMIASTGSERSYYAQVANGEEYRIPRGSSERLLGAMGLTDAGQLRQYRALLRIPDGLWKQADDENWDEYRIRDFNKNSDTVTTVTVSESTERPSAPTPTSPKTSSKPATAAAEKFVRRSVARASADPVARASLIEIFENAIADLRKLS